MTKIIIVGNGMVGHRLVEFLVEANLHEKMEIIVFGEEVRAAYDRVHLSEYFSGKTADELSLVTPGFYENSKVTLMTGEKITEIDKAAKQVTTASGKVVDYDKLVLATGSYPFVPPIEGRDRDQCHVYRTIEDLDDMQSSGNQSKVGVVVGGGLLGLEAANALKNMGLETHVVEFAPRLMMVQVDEGGGNVLRRKIEALGVHVHTGKNTVEIVDGDTHKHKMVFADGETLETDMIVFSAGIRPQDELARQSGLSLGERGGILINNQCQTSDENIFAVGECALWNNQVFGLVAPGYQMAKVVAEQLQQKPENFTGADMSTKLKLMGVDVASIGDAHGKISGSRAYTYIDEPNEVYKKIVVSEDGQHLLGAVLIGDADEYNNLLQIMLNDIPLPENPDVLILPSHGDTPAVGLGPDALPESATICSCHNVSKGDLCEAVVTGCCDMGALKDSTKAGTGCGGCVPLVKQIMDAELLKAGFEINTDLCEHFPHTRQELYHLIRVGEIRSFSELLSKHGKGMGCDICKPTAASIFASCWNDYVLTSDNQGLQDTNDTYLANMQKDGTYSIVPRVAGGEITPDKLIVLGEVAKKYDLYTKITGGQRIDLFGARQEQLPEIWKILVDAGFETGHAYGKSLRTVKSCVGSTWCRYGVLDSVGQAIDLENRYKGLRAPHKIKFGVSGCTRECAEAQGKDVGVIATETGWNLYVCGNGGMKPRHADLFATDLDDATLVKYIDRFLMFYIKTADRLQRTSNWLTNLEGGLEYLKQVIIEDRLGIADELEQQMETVIANYQCEWKATVENPEKVKFFKSFINSDKKDETVVFVRERDQIRPATEDEKLTVEDQQYPVTEVA